MCGRYSTAKIPKKKFEEKLKVKLEDYSPSFNACPGTTHPVISSNGDMTKISNMTWGLIPYWSKTPNPKIKPINARSETLWQKPSFKNLIKNKRCLIPASGYYEWHSSETGKTPHFIYAADESPLAFGALYDSWNNGQDIQISSYAIITKKAASCINFIHDRMPIVVPEVLWNDWINPKSPPDLINEMINDSIHRFNFHPVSNLVNNPRNDSPALTDPV